MIRAFLDLRRPSLARGNALVLGSLILAAALSHFPHLLPNPWIALPALLVFFGTLETLRNIRRRWSFYHAGVILCLYMDVMVLFTVLFFLFYPLVDLGARHR